MAATMSLSERIMQAFKQKRHLLDKAKYPNFRMVGYPDIATRIPETPDCRSPDKNDARSAVLSGSIALQISQRRNDWR